MSRNLKPYKVDHVLSPNGYSEADVMFDRNSKSFFVEIIPGDLDSRVTADTVKDVKKLAATALANAQKYEWTPIIVVSVSEHWKGGRFEHDASIVFKFRRLERSPNPARADRFVARPHPLDVVKGDSGRDRTHCDVGPCSDTGKVGSSENGEAVLAYSQEVWDGLVAIQDTITDAYTRLNKLLARKDAAHVLALGARSNHAAALRGVRLLASPDE